MTTPVKSTIVVDGTILLPAGKSIENGSIIIKDGKIGRIISTQESMKLERSALPTLFQDVIDATGLYVCAGFVDPHTHVSLHNEGVTAPLGSDINENHAPVAPYLRAIDAVYHDDEAFQQALTSGVTTIAITPGSNNVVCGTALAVKTKRGTVLEKLVKDPVAMKISLGENPRMTHGNSRVPSTRMGIAYLFRQALVDANFYRKQKNENTKRDLGMEAMALLLEKKIRAKIHCHRSDDIVTATRICEEFNIDYTLDHCTEGHLIAEHLGKRKAYCIIGPVMAFRGKNEIRNRTHKTAAILHRHGCTVSLTTDHPVVPIQLFLQQVSEVVAQGELPLEVALDCITVNSANALGIGDRVGTIAVGLDADLVLTTARPGDPSCRVVTTIIDGEIVWQATPTLKTSYSDNTTV